MEKHGLSINISLDKFSPTTHLKPMVVELDEASIHNRNFERYAPGGMPRRPGLEFCILAECLQRNHFSNDQFPVILAVDLDVR